MQLGRYIYNIYEDMAKCSVMPHDVTKNARCRLIRVSVDCQIRSSCSMFSKLTGQITCTVPGTNDTFRYDAFRAAVQ